MHRRAQRLGSLNPFTYSPFAALREGKSADRCYDSSMRRHVPIIGALLTAALVSGAIPAFAVGAGQTELPPDRFRLVCAGTMSVAGQTSQIEADGLLDLAVGTVTGFGVGAARVVLTTPSTIGFDSSEMGAERLASVADTPDVRPRRKGPSTIVRGTFGRLDGRLRISVVSAADPADVVIGMELGCRREPALR